MGVDWLSCEYCGENFPDCGDFEMCECGKHWCSLECAEEDGYMSESCKLGYDLDDNDCEESCYDCENHLGTTCKYCRHEDYSDEILLDYALQLLGINRENLIKQYNKRK